VTGILASALGLPLGHTETWPETLIMGVRTDDAGVPDIDYQTTFARPPRALTPASLTWRKGEDGGTIITKRVYIQGAKFLVALQGEDQLITRANDALRNPAHPLFLGTRSCPPTERICLGTTTQTILEALTSPHQTITVPDTARMSIDVRAVPLSVAAHSLVTTVCDVPIADPRLRRFATRRVATWDWANPDAHLGTEADMFTSALTAAA
jgi:CRISPR system Cascade subunit CasD